MMDPTLDAKITAFLDNHRSELIDDIRELVAIHSEDDSAHAAPGAPFGPGVARCLDAALAQCQKAGLSVRNFDGFSGDATWGQGEGAVAVLTHPGYRAHRRRLDPRPAGRALWKAIASMAAAPMTTRARRFRPVGRKGFDGRRLPA